VKIYTGYLIMIIDPLNILTLEIHIKAGRPRTCFNALKTSILISTHAVSEMESELIAALNRVKI
jgi:hypothetical protein